MRVMLRLALFVLVFGLAGAAVGQAPSDRPSDQPSRDEATPRRRDDDARRRDDDTPPPPPKQKGKELFERDFPGPRDGRPGGDRSGPPKGKAGPGDRRQGEESGYEESVRKQWENTFNMFDRNRDGKLDRSEWFFLKDPESLDTDHDGVITLSETINRPGPPVQMPNFGGGFGGSRVFGGRPGGMPGPGGLMPGMPGLIGEQPPPDDPEMRELLAQDHALNEQALALSQFVRRASGEERAKLKVELVEVVNKHFDVRQKRRELQLKRMEDELQRLREAITSRNKSRESIVTNHMKELIGEERDLEF